MKRSRGPANEFDAWTKDLDFAFIGIDKNGLVGLFYVDDEPDAVPSQIRDTCPPQAYSALMDYLVEMIEPDHGLPADVDRGLFQYIYDRESRAFVRIASPKPPRPAAEMSFPAGASAGIVPLESESFRDAAVIRLLPDDLL